MPKRKYKLVSATGDCPKLCAFFATKEGCRSGKSCKFIHELPNTPETALASVESSSVVSSESSVEQQDMKQVKVSTLEKNKEGHKNGSSSKSSPNAKSSKAKKKAPKVKQEQNEEQEKLRKIIQQQQKELEKLRNVVIKEELKVEQGKQKENIESSITNSKKPRKNDSKSPFASSTSISKNESGLQDDSEATNQDSAKKDCSVSIFKNMANDLDHDDNIIHPIDTDDYLDQSLGLKYYEKLRNSHHESDGGCATLDKKRVSPQKKTNQNTNKTNLEENMSNPPNFRSLDLPIAPFSLKKKLKSDAPGKEGSKRKKSNKTEEIIIPSPTPCSFPDSLSFIPLLEATRDHPRYKSCYNMSKYKHADQYSMHQWVKTRAFGEWCSDNPPIIAVDCEMCQTKDPLSGNVDNKALCRISVVNAMKPSEVLLDTLVKPEWPIIDYREDINGINKEDLKDVQFTLRHAQAFMLALCCEETIIVGHAVFNDLSAIKMEHYCNVDSALLFRVKDDTATDKSSMPSLKDCASSILGRDMPKLHDSVNDAVVSFECCQFFLDNQGEVDEVLRTPKKKSYGNECLFIHRLPKKGCGEKDISTLFLLLCKIKPLEVEKIEYASTFGKTYVRFENEDIANLAFDALQSKAIGEKSGRLQKKVYMRTGDYIQVRQMRKP